VQDLVTFWLHGERSEQSAAALVVLPLLAIVFFIAFDHDDLGEDLQLWIRVSPCKRYLVPKGYLLRDLVLLGLYDTFFAYNDIVAVAVYANAVGAAETADHLVSVGLRARGPAVCARREARRRRNIERVLLVVP
jgi:hypothetical protein